MIKRAIQQWRQRARELRTDSYAVYLAYRHPGAPWYAKVLAAVVATYAFSPIDLIPDFIPILGYLDDLILVPIGIAAVIKMIPPVVMTECREKAGLEMSQRKPANRIAAILIVAVWILLAVGGVVVILRLFGVRKQ
jgi:uncharacterized membrane protein YkvA (DUF1232 family)